MLSRPTQAAYPDRAARGWNHLRPRLLSLRSLSLTRIRGGWALSDRWWALMGELLYRRIPFAVLAALALWLMVILLLVAGDSVLAAAGW